MLKITKTVETVDEDYHGVVLRIARTNSSEFRAKFRRLTRPYKNQIQNDSLPEDKSQNLLCEAMAGTVLVGWSGEFPDGIEYDFTEENAKQLLLNDPDCRDFVTKVAGDLTMFLDMEKEETIKK